MRERGTGLMLTPCSCCALCVCQRGAEKDEEERCIKKKTRERKAGKRRRMTNDEKLVVLYED